jgi:FPC/CPF motif-containing protein YcgG
MHNSRNEKIANFQLFIREQTFPCVGAKSALAHNHISFCLADNLTTASSDDLITKELQEFALACTPGSLFVSFAVIFKNTPPLNEIEFEKCLWERLQAIHNKDVLYYAWDPEVSSDPELPHFSMSVGGKGFYVIGLHPGSNRPARQFPDTAIIFNLHSQFELLRKDGSYERLSKIIRQRDEKLSGSENPMLAQHGQSSEARQYSGRVLDAAWKCPFHAHTKESAK